MSDRFHKLEGGVQEQLRFANTLIKAQKGLIEGLESRVYELSCFVRKTRTCVFPPLEHWEGSRKLKCTSLINADWYRESLKLVPPEEQKDNE